MKTIHYLILLISVFSFAQIRGNRTIETRSFETPNLEVIKVNLYAKIIIDQSSNEGMRIEAESNLFQYIDTEVVDGVLHLNQLKWISPSQDIKIYIGAPNLKRLEHGTHDLTSIINLNNNYFNVLAIVGKVSIEGTTDELRLGAELAEIDASKTQAKEVFVNLWKWGAIKVNPQDKLWADVTNDGKLFYTQKPKDFKVKTKSNGQVLPLEDLYKGNTSETVYIKFKIKNNSEQRQNFKVIGPKPEGGKFGYGFPMNPHAIRKEHWTVGTKIYKINSLGIKRLLKVIEKEDEGTVVSLFN